MNAEEASPYAAPEEWASIDLVYEAALSELEFQSKQWEEADSRLRLLLGFIGIIVAGALAAAGQSPEKLPDPVALLIGMAVVALLVASGISVVAYRPRGFQRPPDVISLRRKYLTRPASETKLAIVDAMLAAYPENTRIITGKLNAYRWALGWLVASIVLLALAINSRLLMSKLSG